jgi:hypothetical protein
MLTVTEVRDEFYRVVLEVTVRLFGVVIYRRSQKRQ